MRLYSIWHVAALLLTAGAAIAVSYALNGKSVVAKEKTLNRISVLLLLTYLADFFCMPLLQGSIAADHLPFKMCAFSAVLIYLTRFHKPFFRFREPVMLVGLVSALAFLLLPDDNGTRLSYGVVQPMVCHGLLVVYGVVAIASGSIKPTVKKLYQVSLLASVMLAWNQVGVRLYTVKLHSARGMTAAAAEQYIWLLPLCTVLMLTLGAALICGVCMLPKLRRTKERENTIIYIADRRAAQ